MYSDKIERMKLGRSAKDYNNWYTEKRRKFNDRLQKGVTARNWTLVLYKEASSLVELCMAG
ncbi:hypothetical protein PTI98_002544 [Pleurotus ostreatus]|nr:hypothetical protein PTI98_002544 [Pleurotus ostreatus]